MSEPKKQNGANVSNTGLFKIEKDAEWYEKYKKKHNLEARKKTAKGSGARSKNRLSEYAGKDDSWILSQIANKETEPSFRLRDVGKDAKFVDLELATRDQLVVTKNRRMGGRAKFATECRVARIAGEIEKELIGGALYDFLGYLTSVENNLTDGPKADGAMALNVMFDWIEERHPGLADAMKSPDCEMNVDTWMDAV